MEQLGIAYETVRNHRRAILRELDARSRVEEVVKAHRLGLIAPRADRRGERGVRLLASGLVGEERPKAQRRRW